MYDTKIIWKKCCKHLKKILSDDVYDRWIAVIEPLEIVENTLLLAVANDFYKDWLEAVSYTHLTLPTILRV